MVRRLFSFAIVATAVFGVAALGTGPDAEAAPPCPGSGIFCLDYGDPVRCFKPGQGWKIYTNDCYAAQDCARRCEPA